MMVSARWARTTAWLAALLTTGAFARDISVNTDVYGADAKAMLPAPGHPIYYFPVVAGYQEFGDKVPGEQIPAQADVIRHLAVVLASQGYLVSRRIPPPPGRKDDGTTLRLAPPPSLILVFFWGSMNPSQVATSGGSVNGGSSSVGTTTTINQDRMIALVAGQGMDNLAMDSLKFEGIFQSIEHDGRYFVIVSAYDYDAWVRRHKKVHLWVTRMSIPSIGLWMPQVVAPLITAGGPFFGRETFQPRQIHPPEGQVEVGQPVVVPSGSMAPAASGR